MEHLDELGRILAKISMGCCCSNEIKEDERHLPKVQIAEQSDDLSSSSDKQLPNVKTNIIPLLDGPSPLSFEKLSSSSDSSSIEVHMEKIEQLLQTDRIDEAMRAITEEESGFETFDDK